MYEVNASDINVQHALREGNGDLQQYILGKADEDDYTGFPKIIMYFAGDEVFAGIAPDYEKSFNRCGVKDYEIKIKDGMFHAWTVFTFLLEGREGEREIIGDINTFFYINRPPKEQRYIKGIVSKVGKYDSSAGTISYHLSDDGIDKNAIVVQGGKGLKGADINNQHQIARGDTLTVCGLAKKDGDSLVLQSPSLTSMETYKDQVTIKAAGWATYVSHRPIDFSQTEGIQAFQTKYEAASNTIVLSPVEAIPENTAVVLKGDPGSYTFTNVASADPLNDNELTFYTTDTPVTEERTVYVLSMKEGVCGFFPYAKGKSMPSYKGCLLIKKNTAAKPFYRVDAKTPTDIRSIKQLQSQAVRYNLAGERVSNRYKGIVIENGRKIIVK